jgi:aminopeptidase 2
MEGESGSVDITQGREVLPTNVKPLHYDVELEPNFKDFTFEGTVSIE